MTKSIGGDVFVPMATIRGSTDDAEGPGGCRSACVSAFGGVPVCYGKIVLCFP